MVSETPSPAASESDASPISRRSASPTKRSILGVLEKPVTIQELTNIEALPYDVETLYDRIETAQFRDRVIPHEVRSRIEAVEGKRTVRDSFFCGDATPDADAFFDTLLQIRQDALNAVDMEYDEGGWNNLVHTPLLKTVFPSRPANVSLEARDYTTPRIIGPQARFVTTMQASIAPHHMPNKFARSTTFVANCMNSANAVSSVSVSESESETASQAASTVTGTTKPKDSTEVDYAMCLDMPEDTLLYKVMQKVAFGQAQEQNVVPHVNQTLYGPVRNSPVAVSIETMVNTTAHDPVSQLGIWIAAWHKRMAAHREYMMRQVPELNYKVNVLPTTVLLEVVSHHWYLYFACDAVNKVHLYGPVSVGSTASMVDMYVLVAALKAIKAWIVGPFRTGMEKWFLCEQMEDF